MGWSGGIDVSIRMSNAIYSNVLDADVRFALYKELITMIEDHDGDMEIDICDDAEWIKACKAFMHVDDDYWEWYDSEH